MSVDLTEVLLNAMRDSQLLMKEQLQSLREYVSSERPDPARLVREVRRLGFLTDYQIKEISRGRGRDLTLGAYTLLELLGEGGMGRVFKAHHNRLGRDVALKVIRKEKLTKPTVVQRFHQEIRAAAQLSHPNVILAFDADESNGIHYFAMELVEGSDLTQVVRTAGPIPIAKACDYIRQAAIGLQHAYERGLVHRDVKPSNLLLTNKGQVKLLDLGLAMLNDPDETANRVTQEGLVLGTPDFLAPEQAQNPTSVDIRADIYALGSTLFFILTGKVPYDAPTPTDKLIQHVTAPVPKIRKYLPEAPETLEGLIEWLMAKRPEDRPQTPAQVASILQPFCPAPVAHTPISLPGIPSNSSAMNLSIRALEANRMLEVNQAPTMSTTIDNPVQDFFVPEPVSTTSSPSTTAKRYQPGKKASSGWMKFLIIGLILIVAMGAVGGIGYVVLNSVSGSSKPLPNEISTSQGIRLLRIEPGKSVVGSRPESPGHEVHEAPEKIVEISSQFFISITEITHGQYAQVMGSSPSRAAKKLARSNEAPVDSVTYDEARKFCEKLNQLDRANVRAGWGYRLPTEAEWEYCARAGTTTPFAFGEKLIFAKTGNFSIDKEIETKGNFGEEDLATVSVSKADRNIPYPVKSTTPNSLGLYDMHGNAWEWVSDYYEPNHNDLSLKDPTGPEKGDWRVQKSGSWRTVAALCRSAARRGEPFDSRKDDVGFRIVYGPIKKP
ncbi:MAG: bifunctional serine/threonine-protein kinase/formylglycine-generating enzyme family protein [Fimbriiglobus sp.]